MFGMRVQRGILALIGAALLSAPAAAQFSDSYNFLKAVKDRDGDKVSTALDKPGATVVNTRGSDGDTALIMVTKRKDLTWVQYMLAKGAKTDLKDRDGNTPLAIAATIGFVEAVRYLAIGNTINMANSRGETPIILAVQARDLTMVRALLAEGANPKLADRVTGKSALDYAAEDNRATAILKLLQEGGAKPKPVMGPSLKP